PGARPAGGPGRPGPPDLAPSLRRWGSRVPIPIARPALRVVGPHRLQPDLAADDRGPAPDFRDVVGQAQARRAAEVAAAGGHHLLLIGPPGASKTMIASPIPGILPRLGTDGALAGYAI